MKSLLLLFLILPILSFGQPAIRLIKFEHSSCDKNTDVFRFQQRIVKQNIDGDFYKLTIGVIANCAGVHAVKTRLVSDTLKISYEDGTLTSQQTANQKMVNLLQKAACDCCFEYTFTIKGLSFIPKAITVNGSIFEHFPEKCKIYQVRFDVKNGDTINLIDRNGFKQGRWDETKENNGYFSGFYINNKLKSADSKEYYVNGKLKSMLFQHDFNKSRFEEYFQNGQLSLQVLENDSSSSISTSFYENGKVKRIWINVNDYNEEKLFYSNGNIQRIYGQNIHQDYYLTGKIRKEFFFLGSNDILTKYYYPQGQLMAIRQQNHDKNIDTWTYYDRNRKTISKSMLARMGFNLDD